MVLFTTNIRLFSRVRLCLSKYCELLICSSFSCTVFFGKLGNVVCIIEAKKNNRKCTSHCILTPNIKFSRMRRQFLSYVKNIKNHCNLWIFTKLYGFGYRLLYHSNVRNTEVFVIVYKYDYYN